MVNIHPFDAAFVAARGYIVIDGIRGRVVKVYDGQDSKGGVDVVVDFEGRWTRPHP